MNLAQMEAMIYGKLGYTSTPSADVITRVRADLNSRQRTILAKKGLYKLRQATLTFVSVADTPYAVLPQAVTKILGERVFDRTNNVEVKRSTLPEIRQLDPGQSYSSATPYLFAEHNLSACVARQPSDASALYVKSTSVSDDSTKTAFLEGVLSSGAYWTTSMALNGISGVALNGITWVEVTRFYIALSAGGSTTAAGLITLHEDSDIGTELAQISFGKAFPRYSRIFLYPTPTAAATYHVDVELHIEDMTQATDEPYLPENHHMVLVFAALMDEWTRREKPAMVALERANYRESYGDMALAVNRIPELGAVRTGHSHLGWAFPSGS